MKSSNLGDLYQRMFVGWNFSSNIGHHVGGRIFFSMEI